MAVIGHGARGDTYAYEGLAFASRRAAAAAWLEAPAFVRAMTEPILPAVRRQAQPREVAWQVCLRHRLDVHVDPSGGWPSSTGSFPRCTGRWRISTALARDNAPLDRLFRPGGVVAAGGFFERRAARRVAVDAPFGADGLARGTSSRSSRRTTRCARRWTRRPASPARTTPTG